VKTVSEVAESVNVQAGLVVSPFIFCIVLSSIKTCEEIQNLKYISCWCYCFFPFLVYMVHFLYKMLCEYPEFPCCCIRLPQIRSQP
jgi:hypothetical protein